MKKLLSLVLISLCFTQIALNCNALAFDDVQKSKQEDLKFSLRFDEWSISEDKIDPEVSRIKGISKSVIDWENTPTMKLLDYEYWKSQREQKDLHPDWKLKLRDSRIREPVGKIIQCVNICKLYRGTLSNFTGYLSNILEGDELETKADSYAWILLVDGSLVRISPNSSITFNEINISKKKTFHYYRLNFGHIHWQSRQIGQYKIQNLTETDQVFLPLLIKEANREYFQRQEFQKLDDFERMKYELMDNQGHITQYEKLNEYLLESKDILIKKDTQFLLTTANTTLLATNANIDLFYDINGKAFLRQRSSENEFETLENKNDEVTVFFRGYTNKDSVQLDKNQWYEMQADGKSLNEKEEISELFKRVDLFIKRIPSVLLAREILLRKFYPFNFWDFNQITAEALALDFAVRLWDEQNLDELQARLKFLSEYVRRIETTNLGSIRRLYTEKIEQSFDESFTQFAYDKYLKFLKFKKTNHYRQVKEMTDVQYYAWMLRYGQKNISNDIR